MEEVDGILIHALKQVGTEVSEDIGSIKQFSSELMVEAVVRCIRAIHPGLGATLPTSLPPGMSARFRVGMSLAQACQELGYKGEIGYQTFLYSNETEIRSLLMFVVEKLPRERSENLDQPTGKMLLLQRAVAAAIRAQLAAPWLPPTCRLPLQQDLQGPGPWHRFHSQPLVWPRGPEGPGEQLQKDLKDHQRSFLRPVTAQLSHRASAVASILERHTAELTAAQEWDSEWNSQGLLSRLSPQDYRSRKLTRLHKRIEEQLRSAVLPPSKSASTSDLSEVLQAFRGSAPSDGVLAKGTHFTHSQKFTFTREDAAAATDSSTVGVQSERDGELQQQVLMSLQQQLQHLHGDVDQLTGDMKLMSVSCTQVLNELKQRNLGNSEKEEKMEMKKKAIDLLPDADNNLVQLQLVVETSVKRVVNLAAQWEKHRAPLIQEHRRLKEMCSNHHLESSRKLSEIKSLHEKIRVSTEEAKKKEDMYKQLVAQVDRLPQEASRSAYTQRILEIVSNIKKQKEEITKILMDTKHLQKEINSLTGKLDRTFAVTDEMVFKDAKKDESVRKSYKYLAALHENCNQLIQTIEDTGTILREIRDLEEQIETENGNKTVANLERILEDYRAVRQENSALAAKVREA
ncbi:coiled-coil domain-containing protein 22 isoform X1 [Takifugu rubripes]|uniref:Coiled-coil domain-containing protein 22 n=1 Tax=Takifugu rubripes TaxID=31033 RepID=H2RV50_TAKRU|nr:coiled-coil domain-containing protein 22 isoform X1 [Takifugu rubripes]|eukprot:XP_011619056.1 PREDICTED: coiled-coil domain-containing protein 22-like [Takifugu rubripes]